MTKPATLNSKYLLTRSLGSIQNAVCTLSSLKSTFNLSKLMEKRSGIIGFQHCGSMLIDGFTFRLADPHVCVFWGKFFFRLFFNNLDALSLPRVYIFREIFLLHLFLSFSGHFINLCLGIDNRDWSRLVDNTSTDEFPTTRDSSELGTYSLGRGG